MRSARTLATPAWYARADALKALGWRITDIAAAVEKRVDQVSHYFSYLADVHVPNDGILDSNFIEPHKPRTPRRLFDGSAVSRFIRAGGGEKARQRMLTELRA